MVLMGAAFGQASFQVEVIVQDNTKSAYNIYQESRENTAGSSGKRATRKDNKDTTGVKNFKVSFNHEEIDDEYKENVRDYILEALRNRETTSIR